MPALDFKRNRKLMVLVNPFSGKVSHAFHFHSECVTTHPESEPVPVLN